MTWACQAERVTTIVNLKESDMMKPIEPPIASMARWRPDGSFLSDYESILRRAGGRIREKGSKSRRHPTAESLPTHAREGHKIHKVVQLE